MKSFNVFNDCTGGEDDQTQNRKNLEIEKVNVQGQHPGSRNARQPWNNLLHSTTPPVDAID